MAIKLTGNPIKDNQLFQANKLNQMVADSEEFKQEQERTEIQKQAQTLLDSYNVLSKPEDVPNAYNAKTITLKKNVTPAETMNQLASDATYKYDDSGLSHIQQLRSKSTLTNDELEELKNYEKPSGIGTVAKNVGVGVLEGVDSLAHPVQTAKLLGNSYMYDTATSRSEGYDTQLASIVDYMRKNNTTTFEGLTLDQWQNKLQYQKDYNEAEAEKWSQIGQQNANKLAEKSIYGDKVDAWKESVAEDTSELGDTGQFFAGLAQSAGFMLPHVVIGAAAGQVAGAIAGGKGAAAGLTGEALAKSVATASKTASEIAGYSVMFDQVYNKQVKDLTNQGYSWKEVSDNAMLNAAKEILTEMLGGGIPGVKDSTGLLDPVLDATVGRVVRKVNNSVGKKLAAKYAANAIADGVATTSEGLIISGLTGQIVKGLSTSTGKFITDMIGEGAEEAIATYIEPYIDRMTIDPNADSATLSELGLSFLGGAVMGGFFNAFNLASTKASANGQVVLYNNGEITLKNASELSQADLDADTKEYNQTAEQFAELFNGVKENDLTRQAAAGAEQMGFDPASVNEMTNDELIRFAKVAKNNAQDVNTSTVYEGDIPEEFDVTAPTGRTYKTFTAEDLQLDDPNLVDKLQARTTMLYAMKSIITGLTDSQAEAFGRSGMGSIGGLDTRFIDFKMPTNIDRMTSADIQQWYTDNVVPAFIRQNEYNARRTSQVARGEELRTYDKTYATRDEFAQMYYQNVPVAEQTPEMMNKAFDVYDRLMEEQRVKQDNFLGNVKYQFSRFGLNARFMTAEEMADPEIGSNNAFYDVETKTVVLNRATITTIEAARIAVAHELVHAIENLNSHSKSEVNRLRGMIDSAMEELGITRDEWVSELQEVYLPKYREWSVKLGRAGYTVDQIEAQIKQALNEESDAYFIQTILANPQVLLTIATNEKDIVNALEAFVTSVSSADPKSVLTEYEQAIADKLSDINKIANKTAEAREKMLEQNAQDEIEAQKKAKSSKNTAKQYAKYKSKALNSRESYQVTGVDELEGSEKYLGKNGDTDEIWIKLSSYLHPKNKDVSAETKDWLIKNGYTYDNNLGVYITPFTQEAWDITGEAGKDLNQLKAANNAKQTLSDIFAQARKDFNDSFEETNENIMIDINEIFNMKDEEVKPTNKYLKDTDKIEVTYAGDVSEVYGASLYADFLADIKDGNEEGIVKIKNKRTNKTLFDVAKPDKTISADGVTKVDFTGARTTNIDAKKVIDEAINEYKTSKGSQQVRATALANKIVQFDLSKDRIDEIIETLGSSRTEINRLRNALRPIEAPKLMANLAGTVDRFDNMYSKIEPAIANLSDKAWSAAKGDLNSLKRYLTKSANGISAEEIKYSGIIPYLEANPKTTKEEAIDYLINAPYLLEEEKMASPKYPGYATRNKENYQEYLYVAQQRLSSGIPVDSDIVTNPNVYNSPHYSLGTGQNLVVHTRESDYNYKGDRVKFIEEIQSDLHSAAKRKSSKGYGYSKNISVEEYSQIEDLCAQIAEQSQKYFQGLEAITKMKSNPAEYSEQQVEQAKHSNINLNYMPLLDLENKLADTLKVNTQSNTDLDHFNEIIKELRKGQIISDSISWFTDKIDTGKIPDEPYKQSYQDYAIKRIIDRAVREDYDRVAWTNADMQVDRYDYEKGRKGYTDLYNLKIPGFISKYIAQWGIKLDKIELDTGEVSGFEPDELFILNQLEREFDIYGPGLYTENGVYVGKDIEELVDAYYPNKDREEAIADIKNTEMNGLSGLTTYIVDDGETLTAYINNHDELDTFKQAYFGSPTDAPTRNTVQSFKINDAMRNDILTKGQPRFMASFSDIRNAAAEDYYDTVDMYGDPFELTDDEIYRNFNALDDELERQWEKAQDDYTTYRYGTPKSVSPGTRTSRVADNILNGNNTEQFTEATRKNVLNGLFSYVRIPNKQREANAQSFWNNKRWLNDEGKFDIVKALESWSNKIESGEATPDLAAEGGVLLAKIRDASIDHTLTDAELKLLERLEADMAVLSVNSASTTQYFAHINKMTGDGRSYYMNRMLGELKKDLNEMASAFRLKAKNALDDYEIPEGLDALLRSPMNEELINTADISETLRNQLTQTSSMEGRITLVQEAIKDDIAAHIPPTLGSRITAWRMLSMLGNIRTHLRNIVSNAAMYIARNLRDVQVGAIEDVFLKNTDYTKSKSFVGALSTELKQMAIDQYNLHAKEIQEGGKLGFKADVMERVNSFGQSVGGRFLEKLSRWNSELLESEDAWFLRANFKQAFASYAKANAKRWGTTEADVTTFLNSPTAQSVQALNETLDYAIKEAKRATYREADALATWLTHQEKKGTLQGILIEGILPFKRTPINILKQGVRYSPIGIINGLKELTIGVKTGEIGSSYVEYNADGTIKATHKKTVDDAITDLCAGMTGTMIMGLGLFLGGTGAMKAGGSDSDREEYYDEMLGNQKYSITIGDTNLTLDWLTPISMPLFAGVTLANKLGGSEENAEEDIDFSTKFTDVLEALSNMADPFTNLSLLSGVNDALNSYSDDKLGAALLSSAENYASQFIPTLAGQIARTMDGQRRTTYAPKDSTMVGGQTAERFLNKLKAKIPFLASTNPEYIDQWGRTEEYSSELPVLGDLGVVGRAINQMATPWYSKTINSTAVDDMLSEVFAESKDNNVLPSTPSSYYTIGGEKYYLDADEYTEVKKTVGQLSYAGVDSFFSSAWLNNLTTDQQADAIGNIYNYAKAVAKKDYATQSGVAGYEAESVIATVEKAQKVGLSIGDYFVLKKLLSDDVAGNKNAQKKQVGAALGLTSAQIDLFLRH